MAPESDRTVLFKLAWGDLFRVQIWEEVYVLLVMFFLASEAKLLAGSSALWSYPDLLVFR